MRIEKYLNEKGFKWFVLITSLIIVLVSVKDWSAGTELRENVLHSKINNYLIFKTSYEMLSSGQDLYILHPNQHFDYYKYSPTFALFMAPLYYMPDWLGLSIWNLLNLFVLLLALRLLPGIGAKNSIIILLVVFMELLGSIQNEQSNGLMAGMILLSLSLMERKHTFWAMSLLIASVYIKLFSLVFLSMLIFYPGFIRNALYAVFWSIVFLLLPAFFIGLEQLEFLYKSWFGLLGQDHGSSLGYSLMGILDSWFSLRPNKYVVVVIGLFLSLLPLIKLTSYKMKEFRYSFISMLLIWVIIFNHKAESPAFVIAMSGIALWFVISPNSKINTFLLFFALAFVSISFSDLTPKYIREAYFYKYSLKALPAIVIWIVIIYRLLFSKFQAIEVENHTTQ